MLVGFGDVVGGVLALGLPRVPVEPAVDLRVLCSGFQKLHVGIVRRGHPTRRQCGAASMVRVAVDSGDGDHDGAETGTAVLVLLRLGPVRGFDIDGAIPFPISLTLRLSDETESDLL